MFLTSIHLVFLQWVGHFRDGRFSGLSNCAPLFRWIDWFLPLGKGFLVFEFVGGQDVQLGIQVATPNGQDVFGEFPPAVPPPNILAIAGFFNTSKQGLTNLFFNSSSSAFSFSSVRRCNSKLSRLARCIPRCNCTTLRQSRFKTRDLASNFSSTSPFQLAIRLPKRAANTVATASANTTSVRLVHLFRQERHVAGVFAQIAPGEPFLETALAPFAQVLLADGDAGEVGLHDLLDLGQGVEPGEQLGAWLGAIEAFIQLVADKAGEAGDFAVAGAHNFDGVGDGFNISVFRHGFI